MHALRPGKQNGSNAFTCTSVEALKVKASSPVIFIALSTFPSFP